MDNPSDLTKRELDVFVARLQQILFLDSDHDDRGRSVLAINPDKEWGGDQLDEIGELIDDYKFRPKEYRQLPLQGRVDFGG